MARRRMGYHHHFVTRPREFTSEHTGNGLKTPDLRIEAMTREQNFHLLSRQWEYSLKRLIKRNNRHIDIEPAVRSSIFHKCQPAIVW